MSIISSLVKVVTIALNPKKAAASVVRKVLLRPTISALKKLGMSNVDMWREVKKMGFEQAGRRIEVDTASYVASLDNVDKVMSIPHSQRVPTDIMTEAQLPSARKYRYIANAQIQYKGKRTATEKYISFYTDDWKPLNEYVEDIRSIIDQEEYDLTYSILSLEFQAVLHQKGDSY